MENLVSFFCILVMILSKDSFLSDHILPIYGNASLGYYYVTVFVGTPPQQQSVIIDTGSGQLAMPCNQCKSCNVRHINPPFDLTQSQTSKFVTCESKDPFCVSKCRGQSMTKPCKFSIFYAEGSSLQGVIIKDFVQFQKESTGQGIQTNFGCTTKQTNLFLKQQANGIFGLAPQRTSTLLQDLYKKHNPYSGQKLEFSLCLAGNGGIMNLGSVNQSLHSNSESVKTTYSPHHNLYSLNGVGAITIGGEVLHQKGQKFGMYGIFIDSGSTFTYLPRSQFLRFKKQLSNKCDMQKQLCDHAEGEQTLCFHLKSSEDIQLVTDQVFPPLQIQISGKIVSWKASKYFLMRDLVNRQVCLGIDALDRFLLGANWMVDRDIVFNLQENTVQIFSDAECLPKATQTRMMSQYTQVVQGHQPLNYGSGSANSRQIVLFFVGIILTAIGIFGLLLILLTRRQKNISIQTTQNSATQVETEQFLQE